MSLQAKKISMGTTAMFSSQRLCISELERLHDKVVQQERELVILRSFVASQKQKIMDLENATDPRRAPAHSV